MNPEITSEEDKAVDMRDEYDFSAGVRSKHFRAMQAGYSITIKQSDGTIVTKEMVPVEGSVVIEPDIRAYFPDSESVNKALRCLVPLLTKKQQAGTVSQKS